MRRHRQGSGGAGMKERDRHEACAYPPPVHPRLWRRARRRGDRAARPYRGADCAGLGEAAADPSQCDRDPARRCRLLRRRRVRQRDPDAEHRCAGQRRAQLHAILQQRAVQPVARLAADRHLSAPGGAGPSRGYRFPRRQGNAEPAARPGGDYGRGGQVRRLLHRDGGQMACRHGAWRSAVAARVRPFDGDAVRRALFPQPAAANRAERVHRRREGAGQLAAGGDGQLVFVGHVRRLADQVLQAGRERAQAVLPLHAIHRRALPDHGAGRGRRPVQGQVPAGLGRGAPRPVREAEEAGHRRGRCRVAGGAAGQL